MSWVWYKDLTFVTHSAALTSLLRRYKTRYMIKFEEEMRLYDIKGRLLYIRHTFIIRNILRGQDVI